MFSLGLDFGTTSVRALLVDLTNGTEAGQATHTYDHGQNGVILDAKDPNQARQHPADYITGLHQVIPAALADARTRANLDPTQIRGIGIDTTGSTPLPVDARGHALTDHPDFAAHPAAMAWLWKDHTAAAEADEITALARETRPQYTARCGGTYSAEWFWAKILRCVRTAPEVHYAAHSWVELADFVPAYLTGVRAPDRIHRSICAAGHKAMFADDWGGLPDTEFLGQLDPALAALRERLYVRAHTAAEPAGRLADEVAARTGLSPGIAVAVGAFDAHLGAVGAGVAEGDLVKVIGTSTCDMAIARFEDVPNVAGLCGIVPGSIVPGYVGFEAGQSAVGDVFQWCADHVGKRDHASLTADAAHLRPGESGLLALDWHNGNRSVLVDPALSGLILGLNLHTRDHEIYRAMIEATAFGARVIVEQLVACGVPLQRVLACGGIARKSALVMQTYADVLGRRVDVAASSETCALGAAIMGAVAAGVFPDVETAQQSLCPPVQTSYHPDSSRAETYAELFAMYAALHDAFGKGDSERDMSGVMKQVLALRDRVRGHLPDRK